MKYSTSAHLALGINKHPHVIPLNTPLERLEGLSAFSYCFRSTPLPREAANPDHRGVGLYRMHNRSHLMVPAKKQFANKSQKMQFAPRTMSVREVCVSKVALHT